MDLGLKLARVAPQLALLVPEAAGVPGRREHRENLVRAHAVLGSAYHVAGDVTAAELAYQKARRIADVEAVSPVVRADLDRGVATLRARQNRFAEALDLVASAVAAYLAASDQRRLTEAHAVRGYVLNEAKRFAAALHPGRCRAAVQPGRAGPRTRLTADRDERAVSDPSIHSP